MTITVNVTAEDIANGRRNSCTHCPVARAILRNAGAQQVDVGVGWIRWWDYGCVVRKVVTPPPAADFIVAFDAAPAVHTTGHMRSDFAPFSFELEIPEVTP